MTRSSGLICILSYLEAFQQERLHSTPERRLWKCPDRCIGLSYLQPLQRLQTVQYAVKWAFVLALAL